MSNFLPPETLLKFLETKLFKTQGQGNQRKDKGKHNFEI